MEIEYSLNFVLIKSILSFKIINLKQNRYSSNTIYSVKASSFI